MHVRKLFAHKRWPAARALRFFSTAFHSHPNYAWASKQWALTPLQKRILLAQFDLAGTLVDEFCIAPYHAFFELFKKYGFILTAKQITGPMGLKKIEHIRHLLNELREAWKEKYKDYPQDPQADLLNDDFNGLLHQYLPLYTQLTPHADLSLDFLVRHQIPFAFTSGYPRSAATVAMSQLVKRFQPQASTTSDEVTAGTRIAMALENNRKLGVALEQLPRSIIFTDASSDVLNLRSAKTYPWIIGISGSSTHVGVTSLEAARKMKQKELQEKRWEARLLLQKSGAHCVIEDLSELPLALIAANLQLQQGLEPTQVKTFKLCYPPVGLEKSWALLPAP